MRIFISHLSKDIKIAKKISYDLKKLGYEVFTYHDSVFPGESISEKIGAAILDSDAMLILLSKDSASNSWVSSEISLAIAQREKGDTRHIIPILIEADAELPFFIKDFHYLDFSNLNNYHNNFKNLVTTLKKKISKEPDRKKELEAKKEFIKAREKSLILLEEVYMNLYNMQNQLFLYYTRLIFIFSILTSVLIVLLIFLVNLSLPLALIIGIIFILGMFLPFFIFIQHQKSQLKRISYIRHEIEEKYFKIPFKPGGFK